MRELQAPERVRYTVICSTAWNTLTGLAAWRALDPEARGTLEVVVVPHPVTGQAVSDLVMAEAAEVFGFAPRSVRRLDAYAAAGPTTLAKAIARSLLPARAVRRVWISPQEPRAYLIRELASLGTAAARSCGVVLSDDGLAFNKSLLTRSAHYWATGRPMLALTRPGLDLGKSVLTHRLLVADARLTPHLDRLSQTGRRVLDELRRGLGPAPDCDLAGDVWFLSQPFEQDSNIPRGQYYGYLERQLDEWEADGLDVRVKLHPREALGANADWIPPRILDRALPAELSRLPIELVLRHRRPRALVGISSTSLLTVALIGQVPAYAIPQESLGGVEFRWHRAAILDTMRLLRGLQLPPERLAAVLAEPTDPAQVARLPSLPRDAG